MYSNTSTIYSTKCNNLQKICLQNKLAKHPQANKTKNLLDEITKYSQKQYLEIRKKKVVDRKTERDLLRQLGPIHLIFSVSG